MRNMREMNLQKREESSFDRSSCASGECSSGGECRRERISERIVRIRGLRIEDNRGIFHLSEGHYVPILPSSSTISNPENVSDAGAGTSAKRSSCIDSDEVW
ncbi:hypothetical protein L195_g032326 [Trifolium pratense]|uniref:Uncharacterized protein n=1 Tax=Trifolium pratense TaxID=57577 RepID=A0A2K3LCW6_TRIPR|nr:hypothetical protein L195_g032326 [Trifolium pratense]